MTFREWYNKEYAPVYEGHALDDYEVAAMAWKAARADLLAQMNQNTQELNESDI